MRCTESIRHFRSRVFVAVVEFRRTCRRTRPFLPLHNEPVWHAGVSKRISPAEDHSASAPVIFFLCFGGLRRLSGMVRSDGGMPKPSRAKRRASLWTRMRSRFFFAMRSTRKISHHRTKLFRKTRCFLAVKLCEPLAPDAN